MRLLQFRVLTLSSILLVLVITIELVETTTRQSSSLITSSLAPAFFRRGGTSATILPEDDDEQELSSTTTTTTTTTTSINTQEDDDEDEEDEEKRKEKEEYKKQQVALRKYRMEQQMLMQVRSLLLSESLVKRGIPLTSLLDVSTSNSDKPPKEIDWDCAMSTEDEPMRCMFTFDAAPYTKVIAPINTTRDAERWISIVALNRLRRSDPSKVEPMWHSQYAILKSWFDTDSPFNVLQHAGYKGMALATALDRPVVLQLLLATTLVILSWLCFPLFQAVALHLLCSPLLWQRWPNWARIVHAAFPLKFLLAQTAWKYLAQGFQRLEQSVRDGLVEMECAHLEAVTPLTVGPGSELDSSNENSLLQDDDEEEEFYMEDEEEEDD